MGKFFSQFAGKPLFLLLALFLFILLFLTNSTPVSAATFTAGAAKRDAPGPFTGALKIQGEWDSDDSTNLDTVSYSSGSQITGNFYQTLDSNQGSIVFWITPEWNGNDNKMHTLWSGNVDGSFTLQIYKKTNNTLEMLATGGSGSGAVVDVSSWTAGTTYLVVGRWDTDNSLDGTNYYSISVNDSHTFGRTSATTPIAPDSSQYLGYQSSFVTNSRPANALIEGLTIYRRPLFDGTYGIDVGNGDEINQIYNSGSGKDPTLVTGSWDVMFALPTNSSTGSLSTGTGEAWSHPHSSNLLYTSTTNTGGFMMNGTYTSDGWEAIGTLTPTNGTGSSLSFGSEDYVKDK